MSWGYNPGGLGLGANISLQQHAPNAVASFARAHVELAASGAATCRTCKRKIAVDTLRVVFGGGKFVHLRCWKGPSSLVPENYFFSNSLLSDENSGKLAEWVRKHNEKQNALAAPVPTTMAPRTFSVSSPAFASPKSDDTKNLGIELLTKDTMSAILQFLSLQDLCRIERVSKAFLRGEACALSEEKNFEPNTAATFEWQRRLDESGAARVDGKNVSPKQLYIMGICAGCNKSVGATSFFVKSINRSVCSECSSTNASFSYVAKKYLSKYGLTEADVKKFNIPHEKRANPYGRNLAPMTIYLVYDLETWREQGKRNRKKVHHPRNQKLVEKTIQMK